VVKTLFAADGRALYFSRSAVPHVARHRSRPLAAAHHLLGPRGPLRLPGRRAPALERPAPLPGPIRSHAELSA
jgi:hypothetical protein